jgi:hypothetical protein
MIFLLAPASRPALGQPPIQWVPEILSPGVKRGRGVTLTTHSQLLPKLSSPHVPPWHVAGQLTLLTYFYHIFDLYPFIRFKFAFSYPNFRFFELTLLHSSSSPSYSFPLHTSQSTEPLPLIAHGSVL